MAGGPFARAAWAREEPALASDSLDQGRRWMLPDGVDEILPPRARQIEALRRRLLERFDL